MRRRSFLYQGIISDYVEIGGIKWAVKNVGANSVTDGGLYFQWGDTSGYTAEQVENEEKYFDWENYKYSNSDGSVMTKYNGTDGKTVLDLSGDTIDDAARAYLGEEWRMPTNHEFDILISSTTTAWTEDYQGSGVAGMVCTDNTDSTKVLFFPANGFCDFVYIQYVSESGYYWSSELYNNENISNACTLIAESGYTYSSDGVRYLGYSIRAVKNNSPTSDYVEIGGIKWAKKNLGASTVTDYGKYYQWADISGYTVDQMGSGEGQKQFDINDYKFWDGDEMTKYNDTDGLTTIEIEDDAANVELRGDWRMPTIDDYKTLLSATTLSYTLDYMGSGVSGMVLTDKTDNTKELFFPSGGYCSNVTLDGLGEYGNYWSASLSRNGDLEGQYFEFYDISYIPEERYDIDDVISWFTQKDSRYNGLLIRPILLIKENRTLNWVNPPYTMMQGASKTLEAVPSLGVGDGVITYTSDNPSVATVSGNTVTAVADGYCTITATITEGAHYLAATTSFTLSCMGYVEIGGTKWAIKNLGASSELGTGLYFQWADTKGYLDSEVGSGSRYKYFGCADYKYSNGGSCDDYTKYGSDGLRTLETSDDAATQMLGSDWKIPTVAQYQALLNATSASWTSSYEGSGVAGMVLTDGSNELFFPAVGMASDGSISTVDERGWYWANSLATYGASCLIFYNGYRGVDSADREYGLPIRPVANV